MAKHVDHYYWWHTPSDDKDKINVENIQKIVQMITGLEIEKKIVLVPDNPIRGYVERYPTKIDIYINEDQSVPESRNYEIVPWQKHTTIKELSHVLLDDDNSFEPDPNATLGEMVQYSGPFLSEEMSPTVLSEHMAEILAMELHYPLEFRREDRGYIDAGGDIAELVKRRQVPENIIIKACNPNYMDKCHKVWEQLPKLQTPPIDEG